MQSTDSFAVRLTHVKYWFGIYFGKNVKETLDWTVISIGHLWIKVPVLFPAFIWRPFQKVN